MRGMKFSPRTRVLVEPRSLRLPPPERVFARRGEGKGGGLSFAPRPLLGPPTPDPSPPLTSFAGGGERTERWERLA
jgi:hypothetical protein